MSRMYYFGCRDCKVILPTTIGKNTAAYGFWFLKGEESEAAIETNKVCNWLFEHEGHALELMDEHKEFDLLFEGGWKNDETPPFYQHDRCPTCKTSVKENGTLDTYFSFDQPPTEQERADLKLTGWWGNHLGGWSAYRREPCPDQWHKELT